MARAMSPRSRSYACARRRSMKTYAPPAATTPTTSSGGSNHPRSVALRLLILPRLDQVTEAAHGTDANAGRLELCAQARDLHLDRVGRELFVPRRDGAGDAVLADDGVDVREQELEQGVFALREVQRLARDAGALAREVHRERAVLEHVGANGAPPAGERRDAGEQLLGREGLREVIVGADREPMHPVGERIARGEHEHGLLAA